MESIVLVGNGRSLLARPGLGRRIDGFDQVVRFNDFHTEGFEDCVGARTDWWARNEMPPARPRPERFRRILLRPQVECPNAYGRTAGEAMAELRRTHGETPVELVDRETFLDLQREYGFRNAPFTGTLVVAHLLRRFERIHLVGFDGLGGGPEAKRHYYSEGNIVGDWTDYHEHDLDARYLRDRRVEGRIVTL